MQKKKPSSENEQDSNVVLPGSPGYRTRGGRSGYDPIDSRTEAAHTAGGFLRKIFTGRLRVHGLVSLVLLGVFGVLLITPLALAIAEAVNGEQFSWGAGLLFLAAGVIGLVVLVNVLMNLGRKE